MVNDEPEPEPAVIVDLFAGHGVDVGARAIGLDPIGIELDADTCATRALHGMRTVRADVSTFPLEQLAGRVDGMWASPPCQDWSSAGRQAGRAGKSGWLVDEPLRWAKELRPRWLACEQTPLALEVWSDHAIWLRNMGYRTWAGVLNSADFGVPQTRRRAILMASLDRQPQPPEPTHGRDPEPGLFGTLEPWVSMASAVGWDGRVGFPRADDKGTSEDGYRERDWRSTDDPSFTLTEKARSWVWERPSTTVLGDPRIGRPGHKDRDHGESHFDKGSVRVTVREALILQSYPPDFELAGSKTSQFRQIGNAVPPTMARRILEQLHERD